MPVAGARLHRVRPLSVPGRAVRAVRGHRLVWLSLLAACHAAGPTAPTPTGALAVTLSGLPDGAVAALSVAGPGGYHRDLTATTTLGELAPGRYLVTAANLASGGFNYGPLPLTQEVVVSGGNTATALVQYTALDGRLAFSVTGVPIGSIPNLIITGPSGFSQTVNGSQPLGGLVPGSYTIGADVLLATSGVLTPSPATQTLTVTAGMTVTVTVSYAGQSPPVYGNLSPGYHDRAMVVNGVALNYKLFIPNGYNPAVAYPVVLFAHGSGEAGNNNTAQLTVGLGPYVTANALSFPAVVVFPQQPASGVFPTGVPGIQAVHAMYLAALDSTLLQVHSDLTRLYFTGVSVGAFRLWGIAYEHPTLFAAIAPVSGGVATQEEGGTTYAQAAANTASQLRSLPIWMWHGDADATVPIADFAYPIRDAFNALGPPASFHFIVAAGRGHELEVNYNDPAFWAWLFAQHR